MKISKEIKIAMNKAEKAVRKEALKPKKKRKVVKKADTEEQVGVTGKWIKDEWGPQEEVFFDGYRYWGVFLEPSGAPGILSIISGYWSVEKWEKRKKPAPSLETTEIERPLSSTPKITKSIKSSKRVPKRKSPTKSGKIVTQPKQVKWQ